MIISIIMEMENKMIDIHTHILPFMDDGAASYSESLEMLRVMASNGIKKVVATPHYNFASKELENFLEERIEIYDNLVRNAYDSQIDIEILVGCEVMFTPSLSSMDLSKLTINDTDYLLIELSTRFDDPAVHSTLKSIIANGFIPILAHVERYPYLINDSERLVQLINLGVITQVNSCSIDNERYPFVRALFKHNLVHLIASDAHNVSNRVPSLKKSLVDDTICHNLNCVIQNKIFDTRKPSNIRSIFNKYF